MKLDIDSWIEFRLGDLFAEMYKAEAHVKGDLECFNTPAENTIRFISRTEMNNGCDCYVLNNEITGIEEGNAIAIGDTTATCFYQSDRFVCGDHMVICRADWLNLYTALFLISILKQEKYKYSYGRAFKMDLISNITIKLPSTPDNEPDWNYMEQYIKSIKHKPLSTANQGGDSSLTLGVEAWKPFKIKDLFVLQTGKAHSDMLDEGNDIPYIGAKKSDNGVMYHCAYNPELAQKGNCIIFICNGQGSVGYANYMNKSFIGTTDIVAGYNEHLNQYNGLFIATVLCLERPKYSFGRKWKTHLSDTEINLPVSKNGEPDWLYMENYMKALPYGDRI